MNKYALLFLIFFTSGCAYFNSAPVVNNEEPRELKRAKTLIEQNIIEDAIKELTTFLTAAKDQKWHGEAYLRLANAYEIKKEDARAEETYKQALTYGTHYHSAVSSQALYRLSWLYERNKKYQEMLLMLLDLMKNPGLTDAYVIQTEAPARAANAYYVLGQWEKAVEFRSKVKVIPVQKTGGEVVPHPSLNYKNFATLPEVINETFERHIERILLTQKDLLEVGEMAEEGLANQAFNHLRDDYDSMISHIAKKSKASHPVELQKMEKEKLTRLAQVMDALQLLKAARRPAELVQNTEVSKRFFSDISRQEKQVQKLTYNLKLGIQPSVRIKNPNETPSIPQPGKVKGNNEF